MSTHAEPPTTRPIEHARRASIDASSHAALALRDKIVSRTATIGVVGLGYVGLPLVRAIARKGYTIVGYDVDHTKVAKLKAAQSYLKHLGDDFARELAESPRFTPTSDESELARCDVIILCVPTPLGPHHEPDLSYVVASTELCARVLRPAQLIVLESTTYPGTTRDVMRPILERTGLRADDDFFLAYSPEREDPGRANSTTDRIPKLVGGLGPASTRLCVELYESFIDNVHEVSSAEIAESAKLLENIYRAVNIALVNELKVVFDRMGIDIWETIDAAKTKPFGFQAFYPGPGLGGHCIPIDPFYLTWKAKETGYATRFIELAGEINRHMPHYVVSRIADALNEHEHAIKGANILVLGVAYKPDVDDSRESPAAEIIEQLIARGASVSYHDPHVTTFPDMRDHDIDLTSVDLTPETLAQSDCVVIVTDHTNVDYNAIATHAPLVVDTRNAMARVTCPVHADVVKA